MIVTKCPLTLILLCLSFLFFISCSPTTQTKTGSLSGSVILVNDTDNPANEPVDFSGVTVALYRPAVLDTTISRINGQFPNIGIQINQQTEFDHRLQNPVKIITTSANGSFNLSKISLGKYNLVVMKENWGVRYFFDINITEGQNSLLSALISLSGKSEDVRNAVELYPVRSLSGYIYTPYAFETNHSYVVNENVSLQGNVIFESSSYIWVSPAKSINIDDGSVSTPAPGSDYARISTTHNMYGTSASTIDPDNQYFYSINCSAIVTFAQNQLNSIITTNSQSGWEIKTSGIDISNMVFKNNKIGLYCYFVEEVTITNCNASFSSNDLYGGIALTSCANTEMQQLIITNCSVGISQDNCQNANISQSYISAISIRGVYNTYYTTSNVTHCTIDNSINAIYNAGRSNTNVQNCNISSQIGIYNNQGNAIAAAYFTASLNNFYCTVYGIKTIAKFGVDYHLNATNNYWGTNNTSVIYNDLIWDQSDENPNDPEYHIYGIVDYLPVKFTKVIDAGVTS